MVARVEKPPAKSLNKAEIDAIFEAGRAKGRTEEVELRQRAVSVIASHMADDISDGYRGYSWRESPATAWPTCSEYQATITVSSKALPTGWRAAAS